jgi:hypothetical protein
VPPTATAVSVPGRNAIAPTNPLGAPGKVLSTLHVPTPALDTVYFQIAGCGSSHVCGVARVVPGPHVDPPAKPSPGLVKAIE